MYVSALKCLVTLALGAAIYGFAIGAVHSWLFAARNLIKFPLLLLGSAAICAPAYALLARFFAARLSFVEALGLVLRLFRDASLLLAALAPACLFLARTLEPPGRDHLGEYPLFLGLNVALIAICGSLALLQRGRALLRQRALSRRRVALLLGCWMLLTLVVGGQWAWYLRPFFGVASIRAEVTPFCLGPRPDFRGARSFYEAVLHLVAPPTLSRGYYLRASAR